MPRDLVRAARHDRSRSLGWLAVAWLEYFTVHGPGDVQGEPVAHGPEMTGFVVDCYALDQHGRGLYDSAFLSRPKGCDKSGLGGRLALLEALGPCRFEDWARAGDVFEDPWGLGFRYEYQPGEPMGRPVRAPFIRCMATEEGQTGNTYDTVRVNLTEGSLADVPGIDAGLTRTYLPEGGEITPSTASSSAKDGGRETFVVFDETHLYDLPELRRMYDVVTRNLRKRKGTAGTWFLETTTMFAAGSDSVAEATYNLAAQVREGKTKRERLLFDHRWGECEDLADEAALRDALADAYGDAAAWMDLGALVDGIFDPRSEVVDSRRYFLNAPSWSSDAWLTEPEWAGCADAAKVVDRREPVTLGFDGSRKRSKATVPADATALIGCRVSDGHVFEIGVWEQPPGPAGEDWQVPTVEVDAAVRDAFKRYTVVGFYADPAKWESYVAQWEAAYGAKLKARSTHAHPVQWWMTGGRSGLIVRALEQFRHAVVEREMTHDGSYALSRHALNARRRASRVGLQVAKEHPDSPRKIDAVIAAVLAWQARLDALNAGVGARRAGGGLVRIR